MVNQIKKLETFLEDENNFIVKLRSLEGIDRNSFQMFMTILDDISEEIKDKQLIEKRLAFLLLEVVPVLMCIEGYYSGQEKKEIDDIIAQISTKIENLLV